jgi:hypothetical protein
MDPAGGDLVYRMVNGPEAVFGQTIRNPFIEIPAGLISHNLELAQTDRVEKNPRNPPPHIKRSSPPDGQTLKRKLIISPSSTT